MTSKWNMDLFLHILCAYLSALGVQLFVLDMLGLTSEFSWITTSIFCAAAMSVLLLMTYRFAIVLAVMAGLTIPVLFLAVFTDVLSALYKYTSRFFVWLGPFVMGSYNHNAQFELTLFIAVVCIISLFCFIIACLLDSSLLLVLMTVIPIIALSILSDKKLPYPLLLPSVFGIILLFSLTAKTTIHKEVSEVYSQKGYLQTLTSFLPLITAGLIISFAVSYSFPAESLRSQSVTDTTNDILSALHLPLPSTSNRSSFNLGGLGYYPLHERLGGPAYVPADKVMQVTSGSDFLLRAATYDRYERIYWSSSNSLFSSRFHSNLLSDQTKDFFDMNRPDITMIPQSLYEAVMTDQTVTIKNMSDHIGTTLFSADHLLDVINPKFTVYYNQSSEIFQNQTVSPGEVYSLTFAHFKTSGPNYKNNLLALENYILAHPETADSEERMKEINDGYLSVSAPQSVQDYALSLTADAKTPLEKVFAIRENLLTDFTYSLDVSVPPADGDFVEYFLATKTGYCTYFASAMTVMAKINGIPARYVEGFVVDVPDTATEDSPETVTVTGKNGHAWCEVYISGIGWIPIDATASSLPGGGALSEGSHQGTDLPSDIPAFIPPDEGYIPPHDNNSPVPVSGSSGFFASAAAVLRPLVLPLLFAFFLITAGFLLLALLRWNRQFRLHPLDEIKVSKSPEEIVSYLWIRSMSHLSLLRIRIDPADTASDFSVKLRNIPVYIAGCRKDTYDFNIRHITGIYDKWIYGRHLPTDDEVAGAYSECLKLIADIRFAHKSKLSYALHFLFRGKVK
ncbi:MAG: transglutaminase-like domain-containing protein [Eubacteriales bacterium]